MKVATLFKNRNREAALRHQLQDHGVELQATASIGAALRAVQVPGVDALLLEDAGAELTDWLAMLQQRAAWTVPVLVLGVPQGLGLAEALMQGAADYVDAESPMAQLLARLRAHVGSRRTQQRQQLDVGPYELCATTSTVSFDGQEISLTAREFALAWALFSKAGRIVTLASLAACVWGRSSDVCKRTLEQHVSKLRRKLPMGPGTGLRIQAVYSVGYRLDVVAAPQRWSDSVMGDVERGAAGLAAPLGEEWRTRV